MSAVWAYNDNDNLRDGQWTSWRVNTGQVDTQYMYWFKPVHTTPGRTVSSHLTCPLDSFFPFQQPSSDDSWKHWK